MRSNCESNMIDLYIYYQVREELAPTVEPRVRAMQAALAASHGVECQLKRRPDLAHGRQTWMEVYAGAGPGFDTALEAALGEAALMDMIEGKRHTEVFMDMLPCA
jgi:hypothetical protein